MRTVIGFRAVSHLTDISARTGLVREEAERTFAIMRPGLAGFLRPRAIVGANAAAAVDRQIAGARKDRARLQAIKPSDRVAEMRRIWIADILRKMREVDVLVGKVQQMPRPLPGPERPERDSGLFLEQMQEA